MKKETIWLDNINFSKPIPLKEDIKVDVLIIGGGITGLSTGYHLIDSGLKICLVEKNIIAHGITSRTTGKLTFLQENIYTKLKSKANKYYKSQKEAINLVKQIIIKNDIKCDFQEVDSYLYTNDKNEIIKIKKEEEMLENLKVEYKEHNNLRDFKSLYAISVKNTAVFHPIKYLKKIKDILVQKGIKIYENSCVSSIEKVGDNYICKVNNHTVQAKKLVIASHYPFFLIPFLVPLRTYLEKSYISASPIENSKPLSAITVSNPTTSIRYHSDKKNYLIYLKGSHNLCTKYNYKKNFNTLIETLRKNNIYPEYIWSNHDIMTEDYLPYIGAIDENLYIGTGYNTWGMTNGSLAGLIISDLILNKKNKYTKLFDPKRNKGIINYLKYPLYISYSGKSFIENKLIKNKKWNTPNVSFSKIDGKDVGIYIDEEEKEHIVYNLCPHLKCSLIFNEEEKTWDCPCHGSRFDIDGKCITGPSNKNITYKEK